MRTYGIDVNALTIPRRTGVEYYLASLLEAMKRVPLKEGERVVLYAANEAPELRNLPEGWSWKKIIFPLKQGWTHGRLSLELLLHPPDVFFSPAHELPIFHRALHCTSTMIHDVAFARVPDVYENSMNLRQEWAVRHAVRCSDILFTPSESTKKDLIELYGADEKKIHVTPLAGNASLSGHEFVPSSYFLCVARLEKKKNQKVVIEASSGYPLVLVGKDGFGAEEIKEAARKKMAVSIRGHVSDEELSRLYAEATALLVPSVYEGFGLMLLEAMERGVPVICSDIPVFHEVAGDAALFVDPHDANAWRIAMDRIVSDQVLREDLIKRGQIRNQEFSWDKTAQLTWEGLRSM